MNLAVDTSQSKLVQSKEIMPVNPKTSKFIHSHQERTPGDVKQRKSIVSLDENANNHEIDVIIPSVEKRVTGNISNPMISMTENISCQNAKTSTSTDTSCRINESLFSLDISPTKLGAMLGERTLSFSFNELLAGDGAIILSDQEGSDEPHESKKPRTKDATNKKSFGKSTNISQEEYTILLTKLTYIEQEMKAQSTLMKNIENLLQRKFGNPCEEKTLAEKYGTDFPVKSLDNLYSLEKKLSEISEARKDMKSTIIALVDAEEKLSKNMAVVIKKLLSREVAMKYTAIKKNGWKDSIQTKCSNLLQLYCRSPDISFTNYGGESLCSDGYDFYKLKRLGRPQTDPY